MSPQAGLATLRLDVRAEFSTRLHGNLKVSLVTVVYRFLGPRRGRRWSRMAVIGTCQGRLSKRLAVFPVIHRRRASGRLADNLVAKAPQSVLFVSGHPFFGFAFMRK